MIGEHDTVRLAVGVTVDDGTLADDVRGASWPLNDSGAFLLARNGQPVGSMVREVAEAFALPLEQARADVLQFVWHLNSLALVNVDPGVSRLRRLLDWVHLAARLAPAGALPAALARRRPIDTRSTLRALGSCLAAAAPRAVAVAGAATAVTAQLGAIAATGSVGAPFVIGLGTGAGLALHEAAHAALLRGVPSALVTRGRRTYVLHAAVTPGRRSLVALGGPLAVALVGIGVVAAGAAAAAPLLVFGGCPFAVHALALTVASGDGRSACGL